MNISAETMDMIIKLIAAILTIAVGWAVKELKKVVRDKGVSEEQADMILDKVGAIIPDEHKPMFRTLRSKWDDPVVTTPELKEVIDAFK